MTYSTWTMAELLAELAAIEAALAWKQNDNAARRAA